MVDSLLHARDGEVGIIEADENQKYREPAGPGSFEKLQLRARGVGEDGFGAKRDGCFDEGSSEAFGLTESPAVDVVRRGGRVCAAEHAGDAVRVDVGQPKTVEVLLEERRLPSAVGAREEYQDWLDRQCRSDRFQRLRAHFRRVADLPRAGTN